MDIGIHKVIAIELSSIRQHDDYVTRDIIIYSEGGDVTITLYSKHDEDPERLLMVKA